MNIEFWVMCKRSECPGNQNINESETMLLVADPHEMMDATAICPKCGNKIEVSFYMERPK